MFDLRTLSVVAVIVTCFLRAQGADQYTDEKRPYEFGFTIDGEQHRHEKKDEQGLIMGEFGFITADGVYHVTVYATDENGNFKILSMKNIRVKPYPTAPERESHSLPFPPSEQQPVAQEPAPPSPITIEQPVRSCSACSIPTTSTTAPDLTDLALVYRDDYPQPGQENYPQDYPPGANEVAQTADERNPKKYDDYPQQNYPQQNYPQQNYPQQNYPQQNYPQQNYPEQNYPAQNYPEQNYPEQNYPAQVPPREPQLISAQMQIVDKNTDINALAPGERPGLPNGVTTGTVDRLLYTFNYTVGFHGHHEEGYANGAKKGYYYVTGRNGIRTRVDYEADENGFRPKITQEVLDLVSEDVPKPETEKDAKYGLKFYEFKWLYYPSDA